jgi:hypothetical protein
MSTNNEGVSSSAENVINSASMKSIKEKIKFFEKQKNEIAKKLPSNRNYKNNESSVKATFNHENDTTVTSETSSINNDITKNEVVKDEIYSLHCIVTIPFRTPDQDHQWKMKRFLKFRAT